MPPSPPSPAFSPVLADFSSGVVSTNLLASKQTSRPLKFDLQKAMDGALVDLKAAATTPVAPLAPMRKQLSQHESTAALHPEKSLAMDHHAQLAPTQTPRLVCASSDVKHSHPLFRASKFSSGTDLFAKSAPVSAGISTDSSQGSSVPLVWSDSQELQEIVVGETLTKSPRLMGRMLSDDVYSTESRGPLGVKAPTRRALGIKESLREGHAPVQNVVGMGRLREQERAQQQQHESSRSPDPGGVGAGMGVGVEFGKDIVLRKDRDLSMALDELECNLRRRTSGMEVVTGGGFGCQDSAFDGEEKAGHTETPEKSKRNEQSEAVVISGAAGASTVSDSPARMFADQCMKPSTSDEFTGEAKRRLEFMLLEAETYMQIAHQHQDHNQVQALEAAIQDVENKLQAIQRGDGLPAAGEFLETVDPAINAAYLKERQRERESKRAQCGIAPGLIGQPERASTGTDDSNAAGLMEKGSLGSGNGTLATPSADRALQSNASPFGIRGSHPLPPSHTPPPLPAVHNEGLMQALGQVTSVDTASTANPGGEKQHSVATSPSPLPWKGWGLSMSKSPVALLKTPLVKLADTLLRDADSVDDHRRALQRERGREARQRERVAILNRSGGASTSADTSASGLVQHPSTPVRPVFDGQVDQRAIRDLKGGKKARVGFFKRVTATICRGSGQWFLINGPDVSPAGETVGASDCQMGPSNTEKMIRLREASPEPSGRGLHAQASAEDPEEDTEEPSFPTPEPEIEGFRIGGMVDEDEDNSSGGDDTKAEARALVPSPIAAAQGTNAHRKTPVTSFSRRKGPEMRAREAAEAAAEVKATSEHTNPDALASTKSPEMRAREAAEKARSLLAAQSTPDRVKAIASAVEAAAEAASTAASVRKTPGAASGQSVVVARQLLTLEEQRLNRDEKRDGLGAKARDDASSHATLDEVRNAWLQQQQAQEGAEARQEMNLKSDPNSTQQLTRVGSSAESYPRLPLIDILAKIPPSPFPSPQEAVSDARTVDGKGRRVDAASKTRTKEKTVLPLFPSLKKLKKVGKGLMASLIGDTIPTIPVSSHVQFSRPLHTCFDV